MVTALGMLSGGLDSILAARVLQEQNINIETVAFVTPFFGPAAAQKAAEQLGIPLHILDITEKHFEMLKAPKHGYGRNMNPCIDCHALMFNQAGHLMEKIGAHLLFSGEVLGERPMSQNLQALKIVARESGYQEYIVRPLSARLLPVTQPEIEGLVNRDNLLELQGRSRKPQIALAEKFGITSYPGPAGGCKLTDPGFSKRLRELLHHDPACGRRDLELLKIGRHLRTRDGIKIIIGRNEQENGHIETLRREGDMLLSMDDIPGPVAIIPGGADDEAVGFAAGACVRYSDAQGDDPVAVLLFKDDQTAETITASACAPDLLKELLII